MTGEFRAEGNRNPEHVIDCHENRQGDKNMFANRRYGRLGASVAATLLLASSQLLAQEAKAAVVKFNIDPQPLAQAINEWADQSGLQVIWPVGDPIAHQSSRAVRGRLEPMEALRVLLGETGLTYSVISGGQTVAIHGREDGTRWGRSSPRAVGQAPLDHTKTSDLSLAMAASTNPASSEMAEQGQGSARERGELEEIVVTGSRLRTASPERGPTEVVSFNQERIVQLGASNVADVLTYLPQQSFSETARTSFGGARSLQLRGLSAGTTLVLINGRRTMTSALQGAYGSFDANNIPLSAVDRIEVLSSSASSVYGADAVGGVVNVVLKDTIEQPTLELSYGAADGGAEEARASFATGVSGDRFRIAAVVDYLDVSPLYGRDRALTKSQDFRRFGGLDLRSTNANPGNVCSLDGLNLPGLSSSCAAVPSGGNGIGLTPSDFQSTEDQVNRESVGAYESLVLDSKRGSASGSGEWDLSNTIGIFAELQYSSMKSERQLSPPTIPGAVVPATNAFNPFGVDLIVNYLLTEVGPRRERYESDFRRGLLGIRGSYDRWDWEIAAFKIAEDADYVVSNQILDSARDEALASSDPSTALNVFGDGSGGTSSLLSSLIAPPERNNFSTDATQASAFVRGTLGQLRSGAVEAAFGMESRKEGLLYNSLGTFVDADRKSSSAFLELRTPLIAPEMHATAARELVLTLSGRLDDYDDFGSTFNPQIGAVWEISSGFLLRSSWGTSFRAPSLFEAYSPPVVFQSFVIDPTRDDGQFVPVDLILSGSPELDPEESRFFSFGAMITPESGYAPRFSATYWKIHQSSRVISPGDAILFHEDRFPDRIIRAAPTPAEIADGLPGSLISVDESYLNAGTLDTSGVDLSVNGSIVGPAGEFQGLLSTTWVASYESADFPESPLVDKIGVASLTGTIPRCKAVATLAWSKGGIGVSGTAKYTCPYDDADFTGTRTGLQVDPPVTLDVQLNLNFTSIGLARSNLTDGLSLRAGVINLFDEKTPFSSVAFRNGFDSTQADIRGRFAYMRVAKSF
jgi:iron complex outermembrane recepter protein